MATRSLPICDGSARPQRPSATAQRTLNRHLRRLTTSTATICDGSARGSVGDMSETRIPDKLAVSPAVPDRNLALELVRVTEAAAMAAGRWVGRGDKNGADGVAVNAMRVLISTVGMRGIVVIGEGEKDNAPMLFNGEQVGDGSGPECDVAVDPIDGTTLTAKGMANAVVGARGLPARLDVRPVRRVLHGEAGHRSGGRRRRRHPLPRRREHPPGRQGQGQPPRGRHRGAARPAPTRGAGRGDPRHRRPDQVHRRRRRRRRDHGRPRRAPASTCCSASAAPPRGSSPPAR